ncbi:hypothetical protein HCN44_011182 [Aphidius gifuensis]|uniref:Uncharacterized protein n=1 Tax=Aphidius gifuensis TaxID=684658 RepID=A0A834XUU4_APHGI|nr:hypothetical protein HCN44_011182 [Aphidius gifuensis]
MSEDKKALIADKEISTSTWTKKKKYIFALSLLTILLVIIAGALIFYDYQGSQNGVHLNDHQKKSVTNSPGNEQKSTTDNFKKFEHIVSPSTGYIGYSTLLACNTIGQANLKSHFWSKDGIKIDTSNKEKYELHDGDLEIHNLTENDAGVYSFLLIYDGNVKKVSYNLIIQDAYKWVDLQELSELEDPAYEKFYFNNKFNFGQLDTGESLVPGVLDEGFFLTIEMLGDELEKSDLLKVLMINKNVEYDWVEDSNGHVPSNALEAGYVNGEKFYIGSTLDSQQLGVVHPEAKVVLFPDDDYMKDDHFQVDYKVLVLKI